MELEKVGKSERRLKMLEGPAGPTLTQNKKQKVSLPLFSRPPEQKSCISLRSERELLVVCVAGAGGNGELVS